MPSKASKRLRELRSDDGSIDARNLAAGGRPPNTTNVSEQDCQRLRTALAYGVSLRDYVSGIDHYNKSAAHDHATGKCAHDTSVSALTHVRHGIGDNKEWVIHDSE